MQSNKNRRRNLARCAETLLQPGFNTKSTKPVDCGTVYDAECSHCGANLFKGETMPVTGSKNRRVRGKHCCSDGAVALPRVQELEQLSALWKDETSDKGKLLREYSRTDFVNATRGVRAVAYVQVDLTVSEALLQTSSLVSASCIQKSGSQA